ncbi:uncharacterized protein LOC131259507 [Anopheles coustani]|uniref:uncharacterized protein LOC131259507 n=1 Tax=Anopheles coustani TaxID=139045 RepID=UPI00265A44EE|nr:uncharacterized protein LOC131259507 [Anopheles coustani]
MAGVPVSCENDPNFGIILSFVEQFGPLLDIGEFNIAELKSMLENSETVPQALADLHIKLMRKINKKVPAARWELALAKYAHSYSHQDAWEIERFGYKTANLAVKLRVLKALLEGQFDLNTKFKTQINTTGASELRLDPLGRDRQGNCYWYFMDETANLQIYQSDAEMETWTLVARNRDEFVNMIEMLKDNRPIEPLPAGNAMEEEDESAGSASDSEALKLGSILAPSETPPSLIISRRTYKTNDKINASATIEKEVKVDDVTERPSTNNVTVAGADVEMKSDEPSIVAESDVGQENTPTADKREGAGQETETVAATSSVEMEKEANAKEMQCEVDSKKEELSIKMDPPEGKKSTDDFEESNANDKCIKSTEPETVEEVHEKTKSPVGKGMDADDHEKTEPIVEKNSDEKETEERQDSPSTNEGAADDCTEKQSDDVSKTSFPPEPIHATQDKKVDVENESVAEEVAAKAIIGESIEDPPLVVRGEGNGAECDSGIVPMFSEVIEEPMMFFYGLGAGMENGMGNTKKVEPTLTVPGGATTVNEKTPVPSKAGNGERNSPKEQSKEECSKSSPKASFVHSDGSGSNKGEKEKEEKEVPCNDNGGDNYDKTSSKNEVSAKNSDEIDMGERAAEDDCADDDGEAMELSQKKRSRKPLSVEKSPKVMSTVRGKRNSEKSDETDSPNVSVVLPSAVELTPEKPVEKKRGSRKSSTPKKALDSISATAIVMPEPKELEEKVKLESEGNPEPVGELRADIKPGSIELEQNGDHLHRPQSTSPAEDNSSTVKKEAESDKVQSKDEKSPEDCKGKESKSDLKKSTDVAALPGIVKSEVDLGKCDQSHTTSKVLESSESNTATLPVKAEPVNEPKKSMEASGDVVTEGTPQPDGESPAKRKRRQRNGLVDGLDISMVLDAGSDGGNNPPVRQSRRIAMQKIKEETNRRQIEDEMLKKMKADAVRKKKDLGMHISDDEYRRTESTPEQSDSSSSDGGVGVDGRRRKKKKKKKGNLQQQLQQQQLLQAQLLKKQTTWNSATSPESSSETEAEDYFAEPYHSEEDVRRSNAVLKSDHEFSPESDLETEAPAQPLKRARTARKARRKREVTAASDEDDEDEDDEDDGEDHACQQCKKTDQPEWILLCDTCDKGYHCACLKPVLFTIPEGDWFCPVCQHRQLIERLQSKLVLYDALQAKLAAEAKRREEEEQCAREAELAEQALEKEREEQLRAQKRARQQQRLLERGGNGRQRSGSRSPSLDSSRERRRRRQRQRNRRGSKRRRSSRSRSGDGDGSRSSGSDDDSGSRRGSGSDGSGSCTDSDDMPIYKHLRRRASTKVSYKFNEYDSLIDSAIRREMRDCEIPMDVDRDEDDEDDDAGHGFSKGKDISTIIEATARDEEARKRALQIVDEDTEEEEDKGTAADQVVNGSSQVRAKNDDARPTSPAPDAGGEVKNTAAAVVRQDRAPKPAVANKKARKKKKKLCKIELSSEEEEDDSDEDFRGEVSGSDDDEEEDDDDEDEDENSLSGESESSLDLGHHRRRNDRSRKPSSRAAAKKRRRIVENSDDSEDEEEERRKEIAKKNRKNRRMLDDSDEELDLEDDDEEDSEDYDSDDLCSDTETESSRRSSDSGSNGTSSSSSSASTEGDWRRKKKKKTKGGGKSKAKSTPASGGGLGSGKHIERPKKTPAAKTMDSSGVEEEEDSADSDSAGKGGKTMPRKSSKKSATPRSSESGGKKDTTGGGGEKKSDRKTRGKKIHYIVDDDFESSDDGIRPGVQRPDTPPEEREQFIRRQEEIKRMLAENNAAKAKELATSRIDQLVGGRSGGSKDSSAKDSLSDVPMQVIESARILDIDFLKSTSGNTARISTVDSVVDFDDELPEDFDPDDEMDDEALAKIMEEEDFAHHQLKAPGVGVPPPPPSADLLPPILSVPPVAKTNRRKSIPDPSEVLLSQRARNTTDPSAVATVGRKDQHPSSLGPVNLAAPASLPPPPHVQSPVKALLKPTGIPTSAIMPPMIGAPPGSGGSNTILANALQTSAPHAAHHHHPPTLPPPPLLKETPHPGRPSDVLMRSLTGQPHPVPPGSLHHKPSELSHLMAGLGGSGIPLPLAKGGGPAGVPMPSLPPHSHHSGHRLPPVGLGMPPTGLGLLGHGPPPHAPQLGLHTPTKLPPGGPPTTAGVVPHSASTVAAAVAAASAAAAAAAAIGAAGGSASALGGPTAAGTATAGTPTLTVPGAERRPGRRKKITPLREDLKRRGNVPPAGPPGSQPPPPPPGGANEQLPSAVPSAAHQEQHQRPPPQHASQHHGHMVRFPPTHAPPPVSAAASPVGLRHPLPSATSIHSSTAHQSATAMAAAAAAAAAAQELAIKVHSRPADGGASAGGPGMLVNDPPLSVPSSVAHLSYLSENPLFAHRLGPLPSSILSSGSSSLQRIAAISGAAGPPTVYGDPTAYNGGWKPPPPGSSKIKSTGSSQPPPHPPGMMVGPPSIGSLEHYHEYNPANHYNPYYNVLDRAHLRPPPTIGELHRTSTLSPTTFTTLQPLEFQHVLKTSGDNHHHHHSATSSPASTAGDDVGGGRGSAGSVERLPPPHHGAGGGGASGPPPPPHPPSVPAASDSTQHPSLVETSSPPPAAPAATASVAPASLLPPSAGPAAASTTASTSSSTSTSVFGELVSYFSSQQDDLDS